MRPAAVALIVAAVTASPIVHAESASLLQSGPMVGYAEAREVMLWVQTRGPARVQFRYWETSAPAVSWLTLPVETRHEEAYTAKCVADQVEPGRAYQYDLLFNGERVPLPYPTTFQSRPVWRSADDFTTFTIALGSCSYINEAPYDRLGQPYGGDYEIFTSLAAARPDIMLWLGDNVYMRAADWNSRTGMLRRYTHTRSLPELQPLLASVHHYAIWDDHDFGPNDSDRGFWNKPMALEAFRLFWANPSFGVDGRPGITTTFEWGDVQFFLLDNRYYRSPNNRRTGERSILGAEQRQWLLDALASSRATFKIVAVGGQFLNPAPRYETWSTFPEERDELLRALRDEKIQGLFFLTGDRHFTELARMERPGTYPLYDLTVSPLTSRAFVNNEGNYHRVEGTAVFERNFGLLRFSGPYGNRRMTISIRNKDGKEFWSREIPAAELHDPVTTGTKAGGA